MPDQSSSVTPSLTRAQLPNRSSLSSPSLIFLLQQKRLRCLSPRSIISHVSPSISLVLSVFLFLLQHIAEASQPHDSQHTQTRPSPTPLASPLKSLLSAESLRQRSSSPLPPPRLSAQLTKRHTDLPSLILFCILSLSLSLSPSSLSLSSSLFFSLPPDRPLCSAAPNRLPNTSAPFFARSPDQASPTSRRGQARAPHPKHRAAKTFSSPLHHSSPPNAEHHERISLPIALKLELRPDSITHELNPEEV